MQKLKIVVDGRVQGVGYRFYTVRRAHVFNIRGRVQNSMNGKVEIIAIGNKTDLKLFIQGLWKGPSMARVKNVEVSELSSAKGYSNFSIGY